MIKLIFSLVIQVARAAFEWVMLIWIIKYLFKKT